MSRNNFSSLPISSSSSSSSSHSINSSAVLFRVPSLQRLLFNMRRRLRPGHSFVRSSPLLLAQSSSSSSATLLSDQQLFSLAEIEHHQDGNGGDHVERLCSPSGLGTDIALGEMGNRNGVHSNHRHSSRMPSPSNAHHQSAPPRPAKPSLHSCSAPVLSLSRTQLLCALLLFLTSILASVLATFLLTRDAIHAQMSASQDAETAKLVAPEGALNLGSEVNRVRIPGKSLLSHPGPRRLNESSKSGEEELQTEGPGAEELRLSGELWPIWYNLSLRVFVPGLGAAIPTERNLTFDGDLLLKFHVNRTTRLIELNALKLNFPRSNLSLFALTRTDEGGATGGAPKVTGVRVDEPTEKVFFDLDSELERDAQYLIRIPYSGPIAHKLSGLYLTTYTTLNGEQKCAAVTQMEPTDARRMVPCFDEPQYKAVYRLSVVHPSGSRAVSNAKELREQQPTDQGREWVRTDFDDTLPMSSYLLALVVSDFEFVEGHTSKGIRFRIWARKDAVNLTSYALHAGIKVLEFYERYYGIDFPLPKQDMMAFPDFAAGAMENWGLVTYREKYLLYSPELYTSQQKMAVASVVSHELAHQWFGNLVTMRWWSDLWLNEGFATLMEYLGTDAISDGAFRMGDYFLVEALDSAFDRDARATSHPLFFEIRKAEDVTEAFDSITYSKGASVLRMIRAVMGEEPFKRGLNIYLNRFTFRNAEHADLWDALTEAVPAGMVDWQGHKFSVKQFAKRWTEQTGYPVVQVTRTGRDQVTLSQRRFRMDFDAEREASERANGTVNQWEVPVWWSVNGTPAEEMGWLVDGSNLRVAVGQVLVLNTHSQGFYRIQYAPEFLHSIQQQLMHAHKKLSLASRTRIIDDSFTLAEAGYLPYEAPLNLSKYLAAEKEYPPWEMALTGFSTIQNYFEDEPEAEYMRAYIKQIIGALFERELSRIGEQQDDEAHFFDNLLRQRIVQRMCTLRDERCISAILGIYSDQFAKPCRSAERPVSSQCSRVPVPFRTLAYCEGVHYGTERDWDFMLRLFRRETVQVEKERLMLALACSRDTHTLKRLLSMASDANSTVIRLQDKPSVFAHVSSRIIGKKIVLDFFVDHWTQIYEDFKDQQTLLRSIISSAIVGKSKRVIDQVEQFLRDNERTTKNLDVFKQRLEVLHTNLRWMERNFAPLAEWFREHSPATDNGEEEPSHNGFAGAPIA